jgi:hypothetical protein
VKLWSTVSLPPLVTEKTVPKPLASRFRGPIVNPAYFDECPERVGTIGRYPKRVHDVFDTTGGDLEDGANVGWTSLARRSVEHATIDNQVAVGESSQQRSMELSPKRELALMTVVSAVGPSRAQAIGVAAIRTTLHCGPPA